MERMFYGVTLCVVFLLPVVYGHGRLVDPPSRSSMWRFGYDTPKNYNDNELNCGGYSNEWYAMHGNCGVCGDAWQDSTPRNNEAGGLYGKGVITKTYSTGQDIQISIEVTANHGGWFEFRLCANNNPKKVITHSCLDQHLLQLDGGSTRLHLTGGEYGVSVHAKLPVGLTCTQCVLQWKWKAGNNFGINPDGKSCVGCGNQEEFYGCSDIAIGTFPQQSTLASVTTQPTTKLPQTQPPFVTTKRYPPLQTVTPIQTNQPIMSPPSQIYKNSCHGVNLWAGDSILDQWCVANCAKGLCPPMYCDCSGSTSRPFVPPMTKQITTYPHTASKFTTRKIYIPPTQWIPPIQTNPVKPSKSPTKLNQHSTKTIAKTNNCHGVHLWAGDTILNEWCSSNCPQGLCPPIFCDCSGSVPNQSLPPSTMFSQPVFKATTTKLVLPPTRMNSSPIVPVVVQTSGPSNVPQTSQTSRTNPTSFLFVSSLASKQTSTTLSQTSGSGTTQPGRCHGINNWRGVAKLDKLCNDVCKSGSTSSSICPALYCECSSP